MPSPNTKHQPATPLPWKVAAVAPGRYPFYPIASGEHNVAQVDIHARGGSNIDSAYIAHAANAYPKLVEFIRTVTADKHQTGAAAEALLRELGEES